MLKREVSVIIILMPIILLCYIGLCYGGDEKEFIPWDYNNQKGEENVNQNNNDISSPMAFLLMKGITLFQDYISPVDGDRCPMKPTCSAYALYAMKKHGFFIGAMMTADRLIHESDEIRYAPAIIQGESVRFYDPVSNNDFWFDKDRRH
jgi:hypothetical protein